MWAPLLALSVAGFAVRARGDPLAHAVQAEATAKVATSVTAHAASLAEAARQALIHAHEALVKSRKVGLPANVDARLDKADAALVAATRKAELEQLDQAEWLEGAVAQQQLENGEGGTAFDKLETEVDVLATKTHEDLDGSSDAELKTELDALKARLAAQRKAEASEASTGQVEYASTAEETKALSGRIADIRKQLDVLSSQEAAAGGSAAADGEPARKNFQARADTLEKELASVDAADDDKLDELEGAVQKLEGDVAAEVMEEDLDLGGEGAAKATGAKVAATPHAASTSPDVDTEMPFGELSSFGREDTAQELTDASIHESDLMVDQIEKAQVAEEKRSVFRALTRLRGAAISSFDGIARAQTGNIDEYTHSHKWRQTHPMEHLADQENDVHKWAFPANADLVQARVAKAKHMALVAEQKRVESSDLFRAMAP